MALSGGSNCWVITCECGEVNGGCVRTRTCDACGKQLTRPNGPNDYEPQLFLGQEMFKLDTNVILKGLGIQKDYEI